VAAWTGPIPPRKNSGSARKKLRHRDQRRQVRGEKYSVKSKIMETSKFKSILLLTLMVATGAKAQATDNEKPTIIFVHGI
jgi:hypothetical protein